RTIYFFRGRTLRVAGVEVPLAHLARVRPDRPLSLENGTEPGEALVLQGRPIAEPTVQHGPFVMNTRAEINQAIMDYRRTQFGGWPWRRDDPVHPREEGRFAVHADGRTQRPA
ncbi:MAG: pirin family protein, partial [Myxococcales bacterium]|nr:pirin family protein [Myxococcales bacterium]